MMALDIRYVDQKSIWLDLKILTMTVPAIIVQTWEAKTGAKPKAQREPEHGARTSAAASGGNN